MDLSISPAARLRIKGQVKEGLACFSLANLCLLRCWYDLEHLRERGMNYYRHAPADQTLLEATLIAAVLMAALFWLAWKWVGRDLTPVKLRLAHVGFLLLCIYPLESVRRYWNQQGRDLFSNLVLFSIEILLAVGLVMAAFGNPRIVRAARRMALVLTLLFPALMVDFSWGRLMEEPASAFAAAPSLPMLPTRAGPVRRVVWIVFDELDQRLAFALRQPKVDLPNLDRVRAESLVASEATQTASFTMQALPSLLSGEIFSRVVTRGADDLEVFPPGASTGINWRDAPSVFKKAREMGVNASIAGWHHPYCRMLGDSVVRCLDVASGHSTAMNETTAAQQGLWKTVWWLFALQWLSVEDMLRESSAPLTETAQDEYIQHAQLRQYVALRDRALRDVADPRVDFVFLHLPVPHLYGIYNRERGDFTLDASRGYTDNLALADRTWGELRRAIEQAGLWDSTSVIITSDHGLRPDVWRGHMGWTDELERLTGGKQSETVPFIVKLASRTRGVAYDRPFSNVVCGDLGLAMLRGEVQSAEDAVRWLDERTGSLHAAATQNRR